MSTWVKVHNSMPSHPKVLRAGSQAGWLFVCGLCYCNEHLTDGFVSRHVLVSVAPGLRDVEKVAARLVDARLWHVVDGGWRIHDYSEHQRNADEIRDRRQRDRERKAGVQKDSVRSPRGIHTPSARNGGGVRDVEVEVDIEVDTSIVELSERLAAHICRNDAKATPQPKSERWLRDMRLLVAERGDPGEVERIIDWCQSDPFWRSNILSPGKLRKQFTQLVLKSQQPSNVVPMAGSSHLPEWQRPTPEWQAQVAAHLEAQQDDPPEWLTREGA